VQRHPSLDDRYDPAIQIVDHDPEWPAQADAEIRRIRDELGDVAPRLDHVGSTAVPGLAAKPIIDLQLSVASIEPVKTYREPLERLGYLFVPDPDSPDFHLFALPAERPRTHHLHVCESGSTHERRHLAVRDFLRANPEEAAAYEALKRDLVARDPEQRLAYIDGKETFMAALEARALASIGGTHGSVKGLTDTDRPRDVAYGPAAVVVRSAD
jgi:GrpB-like predicted nucleotidyltransferase (UPF0157 family)